MFRKKMYSYKMPMSPSFKTTSRNLSLRTAIRKKMYGRRMYCMGMYDRRMYGRGIYDRRMYCRRTYFRGIYGKKMDKQRIQWL